MKYFTNGRSLWAADYHPVGRSAAVPRELRGVDNGCQRGHPGTGQRHRFHARNPFPVGGVVEDPATGAAAAALGGYLREARLIAAPATITIRQGEAMGRPSRLTVEIPAAGGIVVRGSAVPIEEG